MIGKKYFNRKNAGRAGAVILTLFLIIFFLNCAYKILQNDYSVKKFKMFFSGKTDYEVMFFGSSHLINSVFPMQLYNDYGIASYNMAGHDSHMPTTYGTLKLSLKYKKPKIAVLDVLRGNRKENLTKSDNAHKAFDAFPPSVSKFAVLSEIFKESSWDENDEKRPNVMELLNPFSLYHSRWAEKDIKLSSLFDFSYNRELGAESRIAVSVPDNFKLVDKDSVSSFEFEYYWIEKFITYCRDHDIIPVLIAVPFPATEYDQYVIKGVEDVSKKFDVPFINLFYENIVDFDTDCYDKNSHLNPSGARKVTDYLGRYLSENFNLTDYRSNPKYAKNWNEWYADYKALLHENLKRQNNLKNVLMLLNNSNFTAEIKISDRYKLDEVEQKLVSQVSEACSVQNVSYAKNENCDVAIAVFDANTRKPVDNMFFNKDSSGALVKVDMSENKAIEDARVLYKNTARLDVKNCGAADNAIEILTNSSNNKFECPSWYKTETGVGQWLHSDEKSVDFSFKCIGNGNLEILLRGKDFRDNKGARIPMKVNYTKLMINDEVIFSEPKTVWHDQSFKWTKLVQDGELIKVHVEWEACEN